MSTLRRRTALAAGASLLLPLTLTGCGDNSAGGDAKKVRMLVNLTDNLNQAYWEKLVSPFEKSTGIDVEIEGPTGKSVAETFPQQLAAGTAPDVIQSIYPDANTAPELLDLSDLDWVDGTPMVDTYSLDGKRYVVGVGSQAQSLVFYNKTAFDKAGIDKTPTTWKEFTAALGRLDDAGYTPMQTAGQYMTGLQLQQLFHPTLNTSHPKWQTAVTKEELNIGDAYQPMFRHYADWLEAGYIAKDDVGLDPSTADGNFVAGKVGVYPNGSWFLASLDAAGKLPFEVGVFSPPVDDGQPYPGPQGATMADPYMIWEGSGNVDGAKQLVKYLATDKTAIETQLRADGIFRQGTDLADASELSDEVQAIVDKAPELVSVGEGAGDNRLPVTGFNPKFTEIVQSLYTGRAPGQAANAIDQWVSENR
ncbi:ABC transporter substrate-binding protein [Streptomyces sp. NPDC002838]|uniref:ABC transporter substrate-binding protein n=1 Tax=Streptomyces sp. NPDC002838 TaxID=3154436 RepID=UPI00332917C1